MVKKKHNNKEALVSFFLRSGLAIVFLYAAVASFLAPENWAGYIPYFLRNIFPASIFLALFAVFQTILAVWLLSNKKIFYASIFSALTILVIIIPNIFLLDIVFRDIAILFMALALAALSRRK